MTYLAQGVEFLIGLGLLGVGVTVLRAAYPKAGWTMAVAGLLQLFSVCCLAGVRVAADPDGGADMASDTAAMMQGFSWLAASFVDVLAAILVILALVMVSKAVRRAHGTPS